MRKKLLIIMISYVLLPLGLIAQDTIPDLIISEQRMDWQPHAYIELTNMGDTALDLSHFILSSPFTGVGNYVFYFEPNTILDPKESYVLTNTWEEEGQDWVEMRALTDQFVYQEEPNIPGDSVSIGAYILATWNGRYSTLLWYKSSEVDSMIIDCFNWNTDENGNPQKIQGGQPIAGVVEPVYYNSLIRKSNVTEGNLGDWDASRGVDAADSEWLLAEHTNPQVIPYRTVGNHGENYTIDVTSANPDVVINLDNGTLTVPWGIYRGDSIIRELVLGDGMAWWYIEKPVFEDSVHNVMQTGDILQLKSFGDQMTVQELLITVTDPKDDMNKVFPRRNITLYDAFDPASIRVIGGTRYYATDGMPVIDTIGDVPFATRVDTLYSYIEWASNASVEMIWVDGNERVDLLNGDILEVTAANGEKKQYYIDVQEYTKSDNAFLSAITWPDITAEDMLFDLNWITDTLPGFAPNVYSYNVTLRFGSTKVPAFKAYAEDLNAEISYEPAVSLKGGFEERTTVITVTSESDTITTDYSITFKIEERDEDKQKFSADPYFSEFHQRSYAQGLVLEIVNPGNVPLDMSKYLITHVMNNDAVTSVTQDLIYEERYAIYVPGYRFTDDTLAYENEDFKKLTIFDSDVDPFVEPGDVFIIGAGEPSRIRTRGNGYLTEPGDWEITFPMDEPNVWGLSFPKNTALLERNTGVSLYLWRIENDSIQAGTKAIGDLNDLTLIDVLGHSDGRSFTDIYGYDGGTGGGISIIRKSSIWHGNDSYELSGGTTPEDSEWIVRDRKVYGYDAVLSTLGSQELDPVTVYISTVSSLTYLVDVGYEGDLGITGIGNGETVQQFYDNLILADTGMDLSVKTSTDGAIRDLADPVAQGDTLIVVSADGNNTTRYELDITPLDDNTSLVPSDGSDLTVADGAVSGFAPGATLESVLDGVKTGSDLSILNIMDGSGALVPLKALDFNGDYQPVLATSDIWFEVVAQNGDRAQYQLSPNTDAADAFVLSSIYEVSQEFFIIYGIPGGTAVSAFMANLTPAEGASVTIVDKADYERTLGNLAYDDVLTVVSSDGANTVTYMLNFVEEVIINTEPSVSVTSDNIEVEVGVSTIVSATAEDDGLPAPPGELSYTWSVSSGEAANVTIANPDQATTDVTFSAVGSYELQVAVNDGELESVATVSVSVITGIETYSSAFRMYPNPASEAVILEFTDKGSEAPVVSIYNITGKSVYKGLAESSTMTIDVASMDTGLYFVKIEAGGETITRKLSVVK